MDAMVGTFAKRPAHLRSRIVANLQLRGICTDIPVGVHLFFLLDSAPGPVLRA